MLFGFGNSTRDVLAVILQEMAHVNELSRMLSVFMDCQLCKTYKELNLLLTLLPKRDFFCRFPLSNQNKLHWPSNLTVLAVFEPQMIKTISSHSKTD